MTHRRAFVAGMAAVVAAPMAAEAQRAGKVYRIGWVPGVLVAGRHDPDSANAVTFSRCYEADTQRGR